MTRCFWTLFAFLLTASAGPSIVRDAKPRRSQVLRWDRAMHFDDNRRADPTDLRVEAGSGTALGAPVSGAKNAGNSFGFTYSRARKRAFRRARTRAAEHGGTWYRGQWRSARSLGAQMAGKPMPSPHLASERRAPTLQGRTPRMRVVTYNVGGMSADLYDIFVTWLHEQYVADIVVVQETHWGLGRTEGQWTIGQWHFLTSADPSTRYAGVCVCISSKWASSDNITYSIWAPGRILHVRISGYTVPVDIIAVYQWVLSDSSSGQSTQRRTALWSQLNRLLGTLPARNVLAIAGDFNTSCRQQGGHIGSGTLFQARTEDLDFVHLIQAFDLCILNSWGRARAQHCATFLNGDVKTQIDYVLTRRTLVDRQARCACPLALDLAPWRLGPRHRPVRASIAIQGCWLLRTRDKGCGGPVYSVQDLRAAATVGTEHFWQNFAQQARALVQAQPAPLTVAALNRLVLPLCKRFFPARRRAKAHAYQSVEVC